MNCDEARTRISALCNQLAELSGDGRFATAAGILGGSRPGRKSIDDGELMEIAKPLIESGLSARSACRFVAQLYSPDYAVSATSDRIRRKLRQK